MDVIKLPGLSEPEQPLPKNLRTRPRRWPGECYTWVSRGPQRGTWRINPTALLAYKLELELERQREEAEAAKAVPVPVPAPQRRAPPVVVEPPAPVGWLIAGTLGVLVAPAAMVAGAATVVTLILGWGSGSLFAGAGAGTLAFIATIAKLGGG